MSPVLDDRGRLFGRVNLVDAAIGAFVVLLVPLAYGALLLFRPATPQITAVDRAQVTYVEERAGQGTQVQGKLKVHGAGLRPTLRAMIGNDEAIGFVFETPASADVLIGDIKPGTHDLVLYDGVQEVARAKNAVTIPPRPGWQTARVLAVGVLVGLDEATASALRVGAKFPSSGEPASEITALGPPEPDYRRVSFAGGLIDLLADGRVQRPAAVLLSCELIGSYECRIGGASLGLADRMVTVPGGQGIRLSIYELVPPTVPIQAQARIRFAAIAEVLGRAKAGDRDVPRLALDGRGAVIHSITRRPDVTGQLIVGSSAADPAGWGTADVAEVPIADRLAVADVVVRLGVDTTPTGWRYRGQSLKLGGAFRFTTDTYMIRGSILDVRVGPGSENRVTQ